MMLFVVGLVGVSTKSGEVTKSYGGILNYGDSSLYFIKDNNVRNFSCIF